MSKFDNAFYGTYTIAQLEKKLGKPFMQIIDVGELEVNKMITLVQAGFGIQGGQFKIDEEAAGDILDAVIEKEGLIGAYIAILDKIDKSIHLFKGTGISISDIKKQIFKELEDKTTNTDINNDTEKVVEFKPVLKDTETLKVGVDGLVSLDDETETDF